MNVGSFMVTISCGKIRALRPEAMVDCCNSCHGNEEFDSDLTSVVNPLTGLIGDHADGVCCLMGLYLEEHPLTVDEWKQLED